MPKDRDEEKPGILKYHVVRGKKNGKTHYFHVAIVPKKDSRARSSDTKEPGNGTH